MSSPKIAPDTMLHSRIEARIEPNVSSGLDQNRGAGRYGAPDLVDLGVGHRDAAFRPVEETVLVTDIGIRGRQTMNHDVAARRRVNGTRLREMLRVRIRD